MTDTYRWLVEQGKDLLYLVEQAYKHKGEMEMSRLTELLGMRDEEEVADFQAQYAASVQEQLQEAWDELQAVPSYVEQQARQFVQEK